MTAAAVAAVARPVVTDAEADDDRAWFSIHPNRRHRRRQAANGWWIVRRRSGGVLLRTRAASLPDTDGSPALADNDKALRVAWFDAAWPGLSPPQRAELVRQAARAEATGA